MRHRAAARRALELCETGALLGTGPWPTIGVGQPCGVVNSVQPALIDY